MTIEKVKLSALIPYERNAKKHPQQQIEQIKKSIQEFGNNDPIAIDENGVIIEGHGRYEALRQLGRETAEVIRLTGLTEEQKKAYTLVHNKLTMETGFDLDLLREELEALQTVDLGEFDLTIETVAPAIPEEEDEAEKVDLYPFTLTLTEGQYQELQRALEHVNYIVEKEDRHTFGNPNTRSNSVFEVIYQWAEQKKLL